MIRFGPGELMFYAMFLWGTAFAVIHIVFAIGVFRDARRFELEYDRSTYLVPGFVWAFTTLVGGVFFAAVYWFIHRSNLFDSNREH